MRTFKLVRDVDVSGVSGTGEVAEGVQFHDGQCVMSWFGQFHTLEVSPNIDAIVKIHGHNGSTKVVWDNENCRWCETPVSEDAQNIHGSCYEDMRREVFRED